MINTHNLFKFIKAYEKYVPYMTIGGLVIAFNVIKSSENTLLIWIVSGIIVTSLGIWKKVGFRNITTGKNSLTQY